MEKMKKFVTEAGGEWKEDFGEKFKKVEELVGAKAEKLIVFEEIIETRILRGYKIQKCRDQSGWPKSYLYLVFPANRKGILDGHGDWGEFYLPVEASQVEVDKKINWMIDEMER
jgi:hypothetical protein